MRFDLIDKNGRLFGFLDSEKNKELETTGIVVVSTSEGKRYFSYQGSFKRNPRFVEVDVMSCFFSEVEHDSNDHARQESA